MTKNVIFDLFEGVTRHFLSRGVNSQEKSQYAIHCAERNGIRAEELVVEGWLAVISR